VDIIGKYAIDTSHTKRPDENLTKEETTKKELKIYADEKEKSFNKDVIDVMANGSYRSG
jgi:hypothetical protein